MENLYNEDIKNGLQLVLGRTLDGCSTFSGSSNKYHRIDGTKLDIDNLIFKSNSNNGIVFSNPYIGSKFSIKELECIDSLKSSNWLLDDSELNYIEIDDKTKKRINI